MMRRVYRTYPAVGEFMNTHLIGGGVMTVEVTFEYSESAKTLSKIKNKNYSPANFVSRVLFEGNKQQTYESSGEIVFTSNEKVNTLHLYKNGKHHALVDSLLAPFDFAAKISPLPPEGLIAQQIAGQSFSIVGYQSNRSDDIDMDTDGIVDQFDPSLDIGDPEGNLPGVDPAWNNAHSPIYFWTGPFDNFAGLKITKLSGETIEYPNQYTSSGTFLGVNISSSNYATASFMFSGTLFSDCVPVSLTRGVFRSPFSSTATSPDGKIQYLAFSSENDWYQPGFWGARKQLNVETWLVNGEEVIQKEPDPKNFPYSGRHRGLSSPVFAGNVDIKEVFE